ncbi:LysE/ArgO family amino acid transporter [Halobacteriovorax marinus]|uniref:LysE/ArgO family amino acid transporter n=1 Tax=Halobacteriovorax marinus TaxID=97084 RepID=UPI003A8FC8AE
MMEVFTEGFLLQASLILALGAQNLFIIDVGIKKNNHILAATICAICDVCLILLGVLGISTLLSSIPTFKIFIGVLGALFLLYYAILKLREFFVGSFDSKNKAQLVLSKKIIILTTLSFTLLNPHVYIDAFFLIGGYSTKFDFMTDKLSFGLGAGVFSIIWFYFLASFSSKFSTFLSSEKNMRCTSLATGLILTILAYKLGMESIGEIQKIL